MALNEGKEHNQSLTTQLSLASLMFFSPFVSNLLKKDTLELNQKDIHFVEGYISLGWIVIILLGLSLLTGTVTYFYPVVFFETLYYSLIGLLIAVLIIGSIGALTSTQLTSNTYHTLIQSKETDLMHTLLTYIPLYAIYLRYKNHSFDTPDPLVKEAIIVWLLFCISCFLPSPFFASFVAIGILVRIISLFGHIAIIPPIFSDFISSLFYKNPEEVRGYVAGTFTFLFAGTYTYAAWKLAIETYKQDYSYLYDIKKFGSIQWQYGLFLIGIVLSFWCIDLGYIPSLAIIPLLFLLGRYGLMISFWKRVPPLPLFRELINGIQTIIHFFTSKFF